MDKNTSQKQKPQVSKPKVSKKQNNRQSTILAVVISVIALAFLIGVFIKNGSSSGTKNISLSKSDMQKVIDRTPDAQTEAVKSKLLDYADEHYQDKVTDRELNEVYTSLNRSVSDLSDAALYKVTGYKHADIKTEARRTLAFDYMLAKQVTTSDANLKKYYNAYRDSTKVRYKIFKSLDSANAYLAKHKTIDKGDTYDFTNAIERSTFIQTHVKDAMSLKLHEMSKPLPLEEGSYMLVYSAKQGSYSDKSFNDLKSKIKKDFKLSQAHAGGQSQTLIKKSVKAEGIKFKAPLNKYYSNFINKFYQTNN